MSKILYLEKRGCDFFKDDAINKLSDVGNYRVGSYDYSIHGKDGNDYILEFGRWDKKEFRTTSKKAGKELKKPILETVLINALHIDTEYENEEGCFKNSNLERKVHGKNYTFNLADILKAVNDISVETYTEIQFIN